MEPATLTILEHNIESTARVSRNKPKPSLAVGLLAWAHVLKVQAHGSEAATRVPDLGGICGS